jgi:hypothetical protein
MRFEIDMSESTQTRTFQTQRRLRSHSKTLAGIAPRSPKAQAPSAPRRADQSCAGAAVLPTALPSIFEQLFAVRTL